MYKIGYQLKQVRERIAKGLVDKGVLGTEKKSFVLFELPTHPVRNIKVKERLIKRINDTLLGRNTSFDRRTIACICAAYAGNVLENALAGLPFSQKEQAFQKADSLLKQYSAMDANKAGATDVMSG